jgi:tetratricopeptide (TPR) repeat protein
MPPSKPPLSTGLVRPAARYMAEAARLREAGRPAEAVAPALQAARAEPTNAVVFHNLGDALLEAGRAREAVASFQRAVALTPRFPKAYWRMGVAQQRLRDISGALASYEQAVTQQPSLAEARFDLAKLLDGLGRRDEAAVHYRRVASSNRPDSLRRVAEALALLVQDRDAEAHKALRQLVAREPGNASAWNLLGISYTEMGRFAEAEDCFQRGLAQAPSMTGVYYDLVRCRRITEGDRDLIARMEAASQQPPESDAVAIRLWLALGKAYDDLGQYDQAMRRFDTGYQIRRGAVGFDLATFEGRVERMIRRFPAEVIAAAPKGGDPDPTPLMILGMPRSGTTLCEQIISSHPQVAGGGELSYWNVPGLRVEAADGPPTAEDLAQIAADYMRRIRAIGPGAARIIDKTPFNFIWTGLIHLVFPNAVIIHCRRNPIDTALSIHQTYFSSRANFPTGGAELVGYYRAYERLMAHWRALLPPERFVEVDYEALTADPEPNIRRLIAAVGLDWDDACLAPQDNTRLVKTPSKWQTKQPIYRTAVERWRRYEGLLGPLADLAPGPA